MKSDQELFLRTPVRKAVMRMAIPTVISSLVLVIYNMADTFFVGQTHDACQVAAVSLTNAVFVMYMAVANLIGIGGSATISILLGQKEEKRVRAASAFCFYSSLAVGLLAAAAILLGMEPLLRILGSTPDTWEFSRDYLFYIAVGAPFILLANSFGHVVRGEGAANASMLGGMIGTVVNIVLDPIFILTLDMGTAGAAIATVLGNVFGCVYYIWYLTRKSAMLSMNPRYLAGCSRIAQRVVSIGIPAGINSALMSISTVLLNNALVPYGDTAVAAMGIVTKVYMFIVFVHMGITNGIQPLLGYCHGAGAAKRFRDILWFSGALTLVCGTLLSGIYIGFAPQVIRVFIDDAQVIEYGADMLVATSLAGPILGLLFLTINSLQAMDRPIPATLLSLFRQGLFFIPLLFVLGQVFGLKGINFTQTTADYLSIIIALFLLVRALRRQHPATDSEQG